MKRQGRVVLGALLALLALSAVAAAARDDLIYHAVAADGTVLRSRHANRLFNPASVVKVGTSMWALQQLGEEHRYVTDFAVVGEVAPQMASPLVVVAGGDPDFHLENVVLVARELNRLGVRELRGGITVVGSWWLGWQNGAEHRVEDPLRRAELMAGRLRDGFDSARWNPSARAAWAGLCARRGWDVTQAPPAVVIGGEIGVATAAPAGSSVLVRHLSNPLPVVLRRFNVYSNNDIVRVAKELGGAPALEAYLRQELAAPRGTLRLATASGERRNRMSAEQVVRLLRRFAVGSRALSLQPAELLPLVGCDPGATGRMFPRLAAPPLAATVTVKSGTLTTTDGGVAVLAGYFTSRQHEEVTFCVAAERAGGSLRHWRRLEEQWLVDLIDGSGGALARSCGEALPFSDTQAVVISGPCR